VPDGEFRAGCRAFAFWVIFDDCALRVAGLRDPVAYVLAGRLCLFDDVTNDIMSDGAAVAAPSDATVDNDR
jgi:hypothetical protein